MIPRSVTIRKIVRKRYWDDGLEEDEVIRFRPPVILSVDYGDGMFTGDDDVLGIHVVAEDRKKLRKEAEDELRFLLEEYAEGDEMMMTDGARRLRNELLRRIGK